MSRPITFLSDYGEQDEFAGACRAVISSIAPDARVIDLIHGLPPGDVRRGALALEAAVPFAPPGVHLAVVDPGVGTARRAVAVRAGEGEGIFVGPDNGLLSLALERCGGASEALEISASPFRREPVAPTFHGRDLFAPVAAQLALGTPIADVGEPLDTATLVSLKLPEPEIADGRLTVHVLYADRFGNLILDAKPPALAAAKLEGAKPVTITAGDCHLRAARGTTFADAGSSGLILYNDSSGRLGIAVNRGSAAAAFKVGQDDELTLAR